MYRWTEYFENQQFKESILLKETQVSTNLILKILTEPVLSTLNFFKSLYLELNKKKKKRKESST